MSAAATRLTREDVVALCLHKQHLQPAVRGDEALPVLDDLLGLHATYPASPYLQLRARMRSFAPEQLDALLDDGRAARVGCMRRTLFIESAGLVPLVIAATQELSATGREQFLARSGLTPRRYQQLAQRIERALAGRALDATQLRDAIGAAEPVSPVLIVMCDQARLVRWRGRTGWRSARPTYRRLDEALPGVRLGDWEPGAAARELVGRYIRRYGPVSDADIQWWTGLRRTTVTGALAALTGVVRASIAGLDGSFLVDERDLVDVPSGTDEVALLPVLDPCLQGYRDRDRFLEPRHQPFVVDRGGNATSVILAGGRVAGVWDLVADPARELRLLFFEPPAASTRRRVLALAAEVAEFLAGGVVPVTEVDRMRPLASHTGRFLSPLREPA